jgi:hypothetical protein
MGRCISGLVIESSESVQLKNKAVAYILKKYDGSSIAPFLANFSSGDTISVSEQDMKVIVLSTCTITSIDERTVTILLSKKLKAGTVLFRLDKEEYSSTASLALQSLSDLFIKPEARRLFELIVQNAQPNFESLTDASNLLPSLNEDQNRAIRLVDSGILTLLLFDTSARLLYDSRDAWYASWILI